jgi:hypothetical protein
MFQTKVVKKKTKHFVFTNFFLENYAHYEIMWKNMVEPGRPQMAIKFGAPYWLTKATVTD